jgi:inhibitor of KinA
VTAAGIEVVRVAPAGDSALMLAFPERIDAAINDRAAALAAGIRDRWSAILRDVVVGYCTVTVYFDPLQVDGGWLASELRNVADEPVEGGAPPGRLVDVPVCYEGDLAPDLDEVAAFGRCSTEEVIALHAAGEYRVYMVGFVPGFAYLAEVDERIRAPRRATPRTAVPAGAVAIAGGQTGIYPADTPGGWNIIGRTRVRPYDPARAEPLLLRAGDTVRFHRISRADFDRVP